MSLYLKYRPADFTNLVWQSFVKNTLQKAIENNKTVWAYLFCWPRWTGKTSTARIFAKSINCENPKNWNPCLECSICRDFADERLIDIIEIDAASHTWVDNIREIIEQSQFLPSKTKYKIYIIDEVHMLSKWAFNALLKILEEPPKHVKFILATTETNKVPETIISRCQRYDFKRINNEDIRNRLLYIAKNEKIKIDEKSIEYITKHSYWWLRNAISLFEQLIHDYAIDYDTIIRKLEIVDENVLDSFLEKLLSKDISVIEMLDKNISDWKNIKLFFKELLFYTKTKSLNELRLNNDISRYIEILDILDETYSKTKHSLDENITFTIWILKILKWYDQSHNNISVNNSSIQTIQTNIKEVIIEKAIITNPIKENDLLLSQNDLEDVFWWNSEIFDKKLFIDKLKANWAKWWLTMAIRWSNIICNWADVTILVQNKMTKSQIENSENMILLIKSLSEIWITNPKIKFN